MKKNHLIIGLSLSIIIIFSQIPFVVAAENTETNYATTSCLDGLPPFLETLNKDYDEWMDSQLSNPEFASNLLSLTLEKFNAYRSTLQRELRKYKAHSGSFTPGQFEMLSKCDTFIQDQIALRKTHLKQNIRAAGSDQKTVRITSKQASINERFKQQIHFPFAQIMGRMKSFADRTPCYTEVCTK